MWASRSPSKFSTKFFLSAFDQSLYVYRIQHVPLLRNFTVVKKSCFSCIHCGHSISIARNYNAWRNPNISASSIVSFSRKYLDLPRNFHTSVILRNAKQEKDGDNPNNLAQQAAIIFLSGLTFVLMAYILFSPGKGSNRIIMSWEEFVREVLPSGEVKRISVNPLHPHKATIFLHRGATFHNREISAIETSVASHESIEDKLRQAESKLGVKPSSALPVMRFIEPSLTDYITLSILLLAPIFLFSRMSPKNFVSNAKPKPKSQSTKSSRDPIQSFNIFKMFDTDVDYAKKTNVKFEDVAGMKEAKQEVMEFVHFLKDPAPYEKLGAKMPRGCLLTGPPGVGKTLLAKAVATEAEVPFIAKAGSDFVEMIGGLGARRIRQLFEKARESAPCIIYIDELDAVGATRSSASGKVGGSAASEKDQTLNQILVEMDGMLSKQHQVIVLASTNRADILDKALLRPGRFDRIVYIDLPTRIERKEILDRHLKDIKLEETPETYSAQVANETPGMSGADLANICNEAAIYAAREGDNVVGWKHLHYAIERVTSGAPKSTTSLSPEERRKVAVHESGHALVGWLLEHTNVLAKITIIPRSKGLLGITRTVQSDRFLHSKEQFFDNMCMTLGGRAAENLIFNNVTQGAQDDLDKVTKMAYAQVKQFGFSDAVGPLSFEEEGDLQVRPYSEALATVIDTEAKKLIMKAYERTQKLLEENKEMLEKLYTELLTHETLTYDEVVTLIGPPPFHGKHQVQENPFHVVDGNSSNEKS